MQYMVIQHKGPRHLFNQLGGHSLYVGKGFDSGSHNDKLVCVQAADGVGLSQCGKHSIGGFFQQSVGKCAAVLGFDLGEVIQIQREDSEIVVITIRKLGSLLEAIDKENSIGKTCEWIVLGIVSDLLRQVHRFADIVESENAAFDLSRGILQRRCRQVDCDATTVSSDEQQVFGTMHG